MITPVANHTYQQGQWDEGPYGVGAFGPSSYGFIVQLESWLVNNFVWIWVSWRLGWWGVSVMITVSALESD